MNKMNIKNAICIDGDFVCRKYKATEHDTKSKSYVFVTRDSGGDIRCYFGFNDHENVSYLGRYPENMKINKKDILRFFNT